MRLRHRGKIRHSGRVCATLAVLTALGCASAREGRGGDSSDSDTDSDTGSSSSSLCTSPLVSIASLERDAPACPEDFDEDQVRALAEERPIGWASVEAEGLSDTTGGSEGEVVFATSLSELSGYVELGEPLIIAFCGEIGSGMDKFELESDKTLIGIGQSPTLLGSIDIDDAQNIVVKNLFIEVRDPDLTEGPNPDGITVRRAHHIWIDHVDVSDGADGNLDITSASDYVTVSNSRFWYRDPERTHRFSNLIGAGDNVPDDEGRLKVTLHHNWWGDNVRERMPRTRYGDIHVFNNYYNSAEDNYCIRSGVFSHLLVESNYFFRVNDPFDLDGGELLARDNHYQSTAGGRSTTGVGFEPPYDYEPDDACDVPALVTENAGPQ